MHSSDTRRRLGAWLLLISLMLTNLAAPVLADDSKLKYGDRSAAVTQLQTALKSLGYKIGTVDGKYGAYTENAVRKFQKSHGLKVDGIAGSATQAAIYAAAKTGTASAASTSTSTTASGTTSQTSSLANYFGGDYSTIEFGQSGTRVTHLQNALKALGYSLSADGSFGLTTRSAVVAFQRAKKLTADGKAGKKTLQAIEKALVSGTKVATTSAAATTTTTSTAATESAPSGTLRPGDSGSAVSNLQRRLKTLGWYTGSIDGKYGSGTTAAVMAFQRQSSLTADGIAGSKTIAKLYAASAATASSSSTAATSTTSGASSASSSGTASVSVGNIRLLHWYNDVKPSIRAGQTILVYEPKSGISWTLRLYSLGRHADAEPLTAEDTANMLRAFGGVNTWSQKAVYVRLPSGVWTLASTHDMPHLTGSIKDNNFDGHLCVHFLRDMDEAKKNDPNYGVSNQNTIRAAWKALTGETVN